MSLERDARLGPYTILEPLGAGGMGEVYRARDTKLDRDVAVKVLPPEFSTDPERLARFENEAKAVAALSHPNILAIHDFGNEGGRAYAVMELLEGASLRERLAGGPLPERKAIEIAARIAQGLAAAHEKGIIHRDLKPDNVMVAPDGRVKILDFGLAKVAPVTDDATIAQTVAHATDPGRVLGTVGYMSPEQVRGGGADPRSDIFALGIVLYEMLTGKGAFLRDSAVETMNAILKEDIPEFSESGIHVSPALDRIVRRCLEKSPEERFQSARDLAFALTHSSGSTGVPRSQMEALSTPARSRRLLPRVLPLATLGLGGLVGFWLAGLGGGGEPVPEPPRIQALTFSGRDFEPSASPDGSMIAFASDRDGIPRIWIKQLKGGGEAPLTEGPDRLPKFSPDGASVLYLHLEESTTSAYRTALVGGQPRRVVADVLAAVWSPTGDEVLFTRTVGMDEASEAIIGSVGAHGGDPRILYRARNVFLSGLRLSPDGSTLLAGLSARTGNTPDSLLVIDMATGAARSLEAEGTRGAIAVGAWVGDTGQALVAQASNALGDQASTLSRVGVVDPRSGSVRTLFWANDVFPTFGGGGNPMGLDILGPGKVIYGRMAAHQRLEEVTLDGGPAALLTQGQSRDRQPAYSPDGERVIFSSNRSGNLDLWTVSVTTGVVRQLTDDAAQDWDPAFFPDGKNIVWSSDRGGNLEIWMADVDGGDARQVSRDGFDAENPTATRNGEWVVYWSANPEKIGLWKIRPDGSDAQRLVAGPHYGPDVSPDGRYATYLEIDAVNRVSVIRVVELETGRVPPFRIRASNRATAAFILFGRNRWTPDGKSILFVGENADGLTGVFAQDFDPERDTADTRREVAGFSPLYVTESFGISPDGTRLTLSKLLITRSIMVAEGVPGVSRAQPRNP